MSVSPQRMDTQCLLGLIFIFVLQFEGGISQDLTVYTTSGHDAVLSCASSSSSDTRCSIVTWIYNRDPSKTFSLVQKGNVDKSSARAARLSLDTNCDLVINNITAEDAGLYTCRRGRDDYYDVNTQLNVLTVSPDPPDADPKRDDEVTLHCSLFRYRNLPHCPQNSIRWVDETGTVLLGEGVGYKLVSQMNCVSVLTVKRQSDNNRTYTCQVVDEKNNVMMEADYTPVFTEKIRDDQPEQSDSSSSWIYITVGALVGLVVVLVVMAAVLIKYRKKVQVTEDVQNPTQPDEPESNLTYAMVSHANQQASAKIKVKEEAVTYSTVRTGVQKEADDDPSRFYSYVT